MVCSFHVLETVNNVYLPNNAVFANPILTITMINVFLQTVRTMNTSITNLTNVSNVINHARDAKVLQLKIV